MFGLRQRIKQRILRSKGVKIGRGVILLNGLNMYSSEPYLISIGSDTTISANVFFSPHDGGVNVINHIYGTKKDKILPIRIGSNVYVGYGCTILGGVCIGDNSIVGANSVVTRSVPPNCVVAGDPARKICTLEEYFKKNNEGNKFIETFGMDPKRKKEYLLTYFSNK